MRFFIPMRWFVFVVALAGACMSSAHAQDRGQTPELPDDFAQGVRAFKAGELGDAQRIWERLLAQYPQRPELLNNMAVLRLKNGDRDQAFYLLARAVKSPPFYASIAANWQKFSNVGDRPLELSLISEWPRSGQVVPLLPAPAETDQPSPLRALLEEAILAEDQRLAAMNAEKARGGQPVVRDLIAQLQDKPAPVIDQPIRPRLSAPPLPPPALPAAAPSSSLLPEPSPNTASVKTAVPPRSRADAGTEPLDGGLEQALRQWMAHWQQRDVEGYLKSYAPAFKPSEGLTRPQWEKQRRTRLSAAGQIDLQIKVVKFEPGPLPDSQWLQVVQRYRSRVFQDVSSKSLLWRKSSDGWFILRELQGPPVFAD